jgi:hypothetical protein
MFPRAASEVLRYADVQHAIGSVRDDIDTAGQATAPSLLMGSRVGPATNEDAAKALNRFVEKAICEAAARSASISARPIPSSH